MFTDIFHWCFNDMFAEKSIKYNNRRKDIIEHLKNTTKSNFNILDSKFR